MREIFWRHILGNPANILHWRVILNRQDSSVFFYLLKSDHVDMYQDWTKLISCKHLFKTKSMQMLVNASSNFRRFPFSVHLQYFMRTSNRAGGAHHSYHLKDFYKNKLYCGFFLDAHASFKGLCSGQKFVSYIVHCVYQYKCESLINILAYRSRYFNIHISY